MVEVNEEPQEEEQQHNCCRRITDNAFLNLGKFTARRPAVVIVLCLISTVVFSYLSIEFGESEDRPNKLWVAQDTESIQNFEYLESTWPKAETFTEFIIITGKSEDQILTADAIQELDAINELVMTTNVTLSGEYADDYPGYWYYDRKCYREGEHCVRTTMLDAFTQVDPVDIDDLTNAEVIDRTNNPSYWINNAGAYFPPDSVLGGVERNDMGEITHAEAILSMYTVFLDTAEGDSDDPALKKWEGELTKALLDFDSNEVDVYWWLERTRGDAFAELLYGDIAKFGLGYTLLFIYAAINLGKRHPVRSAVALAIGTILSVGMAIQTMYGFCALTGFKVTPLHNALTFLLLGLGVDDAFVIVSEYYLAKEKGIKELEPLMGETLKEAGQSIFMTSVTDLFVFGLGATTILPALASFCFYAAFGVLFDFIYQITFFAACLGLHHRRVMDNRIDVFCCFKNGDQDENQGAGRSSETAESEDDSPRLCCAICPAEEKQFIQDGFEKSMDVITDKRVGVFMVIIMFVLAGLSTYGLVARETDFNLNWFFMPDSIPGQFVEVQGEYFGIPTSISIYVKDIDYFANQPDMANLKQAAYDSKYVDTEWGYSDWHDAYLEWANANLDASLIDADGYINDESAYYSNLELWLAGEGDVYEGEVVYDDDDEILATRIRTYVKSKYTDMDGDGRYSAMLGLRDDLNGVVETSFVYSYEFIYWEEFGVIKEEMLRNLCIAFATIVVIVMGLIPEWRCGLCVMATILFAVLDIAGVSYYWDLDYNAIVLTYTLIAVGLAIDYSIHIGFKYSVVTGTSEERTKTAMIEMGPAVMHGVCSTFVAVMVLSSSQSFIFQVFFKMFFLVSIIGGGHGLLILPALLSLFGPAKSTKKVTKSSVEMGP